MTSGIVTGKEVLIGSYGNGALLVDQSASVNAPGTNVIFSGGTVAANVILSGGNDFARQFARYPETQSA